MDKDQQKSDWSGVHSIEQLQYAVKDSKILIQLYPILKGKLEEAGLSRVAQIEFDCIPMTVEVMQTGLPLDIPSVQAKIDSLTEVINDIERQIKAIAKSAGWVSPNKNKDLNLASSQHLKTLLQLVYGEGVKNSAEDTINALLFTQPEKPLAGMLHGLKKHQMQQRFLKAWLKNHCQLGRYEEAIEYFDKALELNQNSAYALTGKGFALEKLKNYIESFKFYLEAIKQDEWADAITG